MTARQTPEQLITAFEAGWDARQKRAAESAPESGSWNPRGEQRAADVAEFTTRCAEPVALPSQRLDEGKQDGAELIGQPIPDVEGTEPRTSNEGYGAACNICHREWRNGIEVTPPALSLSVEEAKTIETRFAHLISTELDHYAQKVAKRVLHKVLQPVLDQGTAQQGHQG